MTREELLNDEAQVFLSFEQGIKSKLRCHLVGIVNSFDSTKQTINVSPAVQFEKTVPQEDGLNTTYEYFTGTPLADVPVCFFGSQNLMMTFPIAQGDSVLLLFNDKALDNWFQSGGIGVPSASARSHSIRDAVAIAGFRPMPQVISNFDNDSIQLRDASGMNIISLSPDGTITLTSATTINLTAPTINLNGNIINSDGDFTSDGIAYSTHMHTGVQTGGSNTGGPI